MELLPVLAAVVAGLLAAFFLIRSMASKTIPVPPSLAPPLAPAGSTKATFTLAEVAKHDQPDDAWIIVAGKVYDVTRYIDDHPGGASIMNTLGGDSTKGFNGPQHAETARDVLPMFYIGDVR
ncbi:cytochrome b5-like heme/steroid binding domain-containing protein [Pelagophyceae sp. CCMP2097]|nr:cytochrome b5-like heme/steroid binding domain-containing protein [Pelagophyceae sp. CCMP2097]